MEKRLYTTVTIFGLIVLFISVQIFSAHTQTVATNNLSKISVQSLETIDMLIFVSPQYSEDMEVFSSILKYIESVKQDIGWNTEIVSIAKHENDFLKIDQEIEQYYEQYKIKSCIMVGEDIDTVLSGDSDYMEKPSIIPWSTIGGESAYDISPQGIVCKPYATKICISLIYPTNTLEYQTKKSQIVFAFNKFSERQEYNLENILICESSDINKNSKYVYNSLNNLSKLEYFEDVTDEKMNFILKKSYSSFFVHGHSNPSGTIINVQNKLWFSADFVDQIDTPIFGADGCYVNGWWSNSEDNNNLDLSINYTWYGDKIFSSEHVQVMALGLLSQTGYSYSVSFIETVFPSISQAKTVAESVIDKPCLGDTILIGDPTFHFSFN